MKTQKDINEKGITPRMMVYLFGAAAERAERGASARLLRWSEAFEGWLIERREMYRPGVEKGAIQAWRNLLQQRGKMPWELCEQDFEEHIQWMHSKGYAASTIANSVGRISSFYRWCDERRIDPECEAGFNPAAKVRRPLVKRYSGAKLLNELERRRLFETIDKDETALGRRDKAFFLARLSLGVPLSHLQKLRWGQIETDETGIWVRWQEGSERITIGRDVWEAIVEWLIQSERMERMETESYIFTPLKHPMQIDKGSEAWAEERYLSSSQILGNLKVYGRQAGIAESKLTLMALRRTAMRIRLDEGAELEEMKRFMDSREKHRFTKYRLGKLPEEEEAGQESGEEVEAPNRRSKPFQEGEGLKHGLYARHKENGDGEVATSELYLGIDEEIAGVRNLAARLATQQEKADTSKELVELINAFTLTAARLAELIKAEEKLNENHAGDQNAEELLNRLDQIAIERGEEPISEQVHQEAALWNPGSGAVNRQVGLEIAWTRISLRITLKLAEEADERGDAEDLIHLAGIYGVGCHRLLRLIRINGRGNLSAYVNAQLEEAIIQTLKEMGLWDKDSKD